MNFEKHIQKKDCFKKSGVLNFENLTFEGKMTISNDWQFQKLHILFQLLFYQILQVLS